MNRIRLGRVAERGSRAESRGGRGFKPVPYSRMAYMDRHQLRLGVKVEMEHTYDPKIALIIAAHHLLEYPDYYSRLVKMERQARKYWRGR